MTLNPMIRRVEMTQATLDYYRDKPFRWGTRDCARMVAHHLRRFGYKVKLPPSGSYGSLRSATRALKAAGYETISEALDQLGLERIAPAAALPGDIIEWPSENSLGALGIALSNGRMLGFHPDTPGGTVLQPLEYRAAWRVTLP